MARGALNNIAGKGVFVCVSPKKICGEAKRPHKAKRPLPALTKATIHCKATKIKMRAYIETIYRIFLLANRRAEMQQDRRMKFVCLAIFNYVRDMAKEHEVNLRDITPENTLHTSVDLLPFFKYVEDNQIQLLDLRTVQVNDLDVSKKKELERYVLSQVYYLTQGPAHPSTS